MEERSRLRQFEDQFHRQLRARMQAMLGREIRAHEVQVFNLSDGADSVRATLTRLGRFDRQLLDDLPGKQAVELRTRRRILGPLARTVGKMRAQVLVPLEPLVAGQTPGPVGREQVLDALARYELVPANRRPNYVVYASPTGFTAEARALAQRDDQPTLVLMGGRADGGWDVEMPARLRREAWAHLFDFETQDQRVQRLQYHLDKSGVQLDSRGVSLAELAAALGVPENQVEGLVRQACRSDARLMTVVHEGTTYVCRSPFAEESQSMSLISRLNAWIGKLLGRKPSIAEQVRHMTAQRVRLEQQRHEVDQRVDALEKDERALYERGRAATSEFERKQAAGKLMRTRRDLRRLHSQANIFTQQIDILGTHIHHLTLQEQGRRIELPDSELLAATAAEAEQITSELAANADLAASIEVGATSPMMAEEEAAILAEFEQAAEKRPAAEESPRRAEVPPEAAPAERPPAPPQKEKRPELG